MSDKHLTEHSGILKKLLHGDIVLADRGFNIAESVALSLGVKYLNDSNTIILHTLSLYMRYSLVQAAFLTLPVVTNFPTALYITTSFTQPHTN